MSNPLLRPNDPRFQPPPLRDDAGNNLFADPDAPVQAEAADGQPVATPPPTAAADHLFAPPSAVAGEDQAYQPHYETTHPHRGFLLLVLAVAGLAGDTAFLLLFTGGIFGLVGLVAIVPAGIAFVLGRADLAGIRQGAIDPSGRQLTLIALWLGLAGCVFYVAELATAAAFIGLIARQFVNGG